MKLNVSAVALFLSDRLIKAVFKGIAGAQCFNWRVNYFSRLMYDFIVECDITAQQYIGRYGSMAWVKKFCILCFNY